MINPFILCITWLLIIKGIYKHGNIDDPMDAVVDLFDITQK